MKIREKVEKNLSLMCKSDERKLETKKNLDESAEIWI